MFYYKSEMFLVNAQDIVVASFAGSIKPLGKFDSSTHNVNNDNFHKILHGNSIQKLFSKVSFYSLYKLQMSNGDNIAWERVLHKYKCCDVCKCPHGDVAFCNSDINKKMFYKNLSKSIMHVYYG
jgi:hypothetical protein